MGEVCPGGCVVDPILLECGLLTEWGGNARFLVITGPTGVQVEQSGVEQEYELGPTPEALLEAIDAVRKRLGI